MMMSDLAFLIDSGELIEWALREPRDTSYPTTQTHQGLTYHQLAPGILSVEPHSVTDCAVLLSCGIHGNETAPIELLEQVLQLLITEQLELNCRLMIVMGNQPAMRKGVRFCEENLNRLFSHQTPTHDNLEVRRASVIMREVDRFFTSKPANLKIHLDLHTAIRASKYQKFAIYPYQADGNWHKQAMSWLSNAGIEAILLANKASGTFSCYTNHTHQALGFTVELGKAKPFGENDHQSLKSFKQALIQLLNKPSALVDNQYRSQIIVFKVVTEVLKHQTEDFELLVPDDLSNFTNLPDGYQLTRDGENSYYIQGDNKAIVFPNKNVPAGQRVALVVEPYE